MYNNYQTSPITESIIKEQKKQIDISVLNILKMPEQYLSDEVIDYALEKNISLFSMLIPERRTLERCKRALSKNGILIVDVPEKYLSEELCLLAVITTEQAIQYIPKNILTKEFYYKLVSMGVNFSYKSMRYINECLNEKNNENLTSEHTENVAAVTPLPKKTTTNKQNWRRITLNSIPGFFNKETVNQILNRQGINTVGDFFKCLEDPEFIFNFRINREVINDIYATIKLLRCKYLDIDPMIDIYNITIEDMIKTLGLSTKVGEHLRNIGFSPKDRNFFSIISGMTFQERKKYLQIEDSLDRKTLEELLYRSRIVIDYYREQKIKLEEKKEQEKKFIDDYENYLDLQILRNTTSLLSEEKDNSIYMDDKKSSKGL